MTNVGQTPSGERLYQCCVCESWNEDENVVFVDVEHVVCDRCECLREMVCHQAAKFGQLRYEMDRISQRLEEN